ncbi:hypothetical protein CRE_12125 [Caenorhabditis remanei]|uniref:BTB domain-containing protein n=1 Tax=Caenorhabditis remanei TaxID=31234 RepID=E3MQ06_CAERE|nr:hypothetical protein CRE_12125 [Caenorhabditis remanei]
MTNSAIEFKSRSHNVNGNTNVLETSAKNGVACVWSATMGDSRQIDLSWKFNWDKLESQGVDKITGFIYVSSIFNRLTATRIYVELSENNQEITKQVDGGSTSYTVYYECSLIPHYKNPDYEEMFASSDQNDSILVVDGKKLHVCKVFLSYHSEYFRALFSSNYKEGQMDEIPIGEVSYEDFALLLSTFYPNPAFPNDSTVEKLLEMGRRFLVSSAVSSAEHHLISNNSLIDNEKMMQLADEYGMSKLLLMCIRKINTVEDAKKWKKSQTYEHLSAETKLKVYERLMEFI